MVLVIKFPTIIIFKMLNKNTELTIEQKVFKHPEPFKKKTSIYI